MSTGGDFDVANKKRVDETKKFWKDIPNADIVDTRDIFIKSGTEDVLINWIESHDIRFQAVFVPPQDDFHFEHRVVSNVGRALTRKKRASVIEYYTPSTSHNWVPNVFIDISSQYERKKNLLHVFKTQKDRNYFQPQCVDSFHTNYFCDKRVTGYVEQFRNDFLFI